MLVLNKLYNIIQEYIIIRSSSRTFT